MVTLDSCYDKNAGLLASIAKTSNPDQPLFVLERVSDGATEYQQVVPASVAAYLMACVKVKVKSGK